MEGILLLCYIISLLIIIVQIFKFPKLIILKSNDRVILKHKGCIFSPMDIDVDIDIVSDIVSEKRIKESEIYSPY